LKNVGSSVTPSLTIAAKDAARKAGHGSRIDASRLLTFEDIVAIIEAVTPEAGAREPYKKSGWVGTMDGHKFESLEVIVDNEEGLIVERNRAKACPRRPSDPARQNDAAPDRC
jgi:hypothetical protein